MWSRPAQPGRRGLVSIIELTSPSKPLGGSSSTNGQCCDLPLGCAPERSRGSRAPHKALPADRLPGQLTQFACCQLTELTCCTWPTELRPEESSRAQCHWPARLWPVSRNLRLIVAGAFTFLACSRRFRNNQLRKTRPVVRRCRQPATGDRRPTGEERNAPAMPGQKQTSTSMLDRVSSSTQS